jgi:ABC-type amino acid transport substrate-binding protein
MGRRVSMTALLLAILAASAAGAEGPPTVRVGLDPRSAPWAFVPGHDYTKEDVRAPPKLTAEQLTRLVGLDVDVLHALERRMGVRAQIVPTPWFDLEAGLLNSRYDLILNAWTPNARTPEAIAPTTPYYAWGLLVAARTADASIRTLSDLADRRIGHVSDPSVLPALRALGAGVGARLTVVDQGGEELFDRLGRSELDAVAFDSAFVRWRVARDGAFRIVGEPLNHLGYHVGVRASDKALFEKVQGAVNGFVGSPEAQEVRRRWESAATAAP